MKHSKTLAQKIRLRHWLSCQKPLPGLQKLRGIPRVHGSLCPVGSHSERTLRKSFQRPQLFLSGIPICLPLGSCWNRFEVLESGLRRLGGLLRETRFTRRDDAPSHIHAMLTTSSIGGCAFQTVVMAFQPLGGLMPDEVSDRRSAVRPQRIGHDRFRFMISAARILQNHDRPQAGEHQHDHGHKIAPKI